MRSVTSCRPTCGCSRGAVQADQSALTGESLPATRKPGDPVFSGLIVRRGDTGALVHATGAETFFGKTARLVREAQTVSHLQRFLRT